MIDGSYDLTGVGFTLNAVKAKQSKDLTGGVVVGGWC
jgi:hypothetical protein